MNIITSQECILKKHVFGIKSTITTSNSYELCTNDLSININSYTMVSCTIYLKFTLPVTARSPEKVGILILNNIYITKQYCLIYLA